MLKKHELPVAVTTEMVANWTPALEQFLGVDKVNAMSSARRNLCIAIADSGMKSMVGLEADMTMSNGDNTTLAMNVLNPVAGGHNGLTAQPGSKGSGDRQFLVGICVALAAKTIGLELVQNVPATSQNVTVKYLNVIYNGGEVTNAANERTHVVTATFAAAHILVAGTKYVVGHATTTPNVWEFVELTYVRQDRKGPKNHIFEVGNGFSATKTDLALTDVVYLATKPAVGSIAADGKFFDINAGMDTLSNESVISKLDNTKALENFAPNQTSKGLRRTLTRSEADNGTDRNLDIDLQSDAFTIGNRVMTANIARLQYKRLQEQGVDTLPYLTAALKNEFAQDINYQIVSATRSYGLTTALEYAEQGMNFNTYIGPSAVASIPFANIPYAAELFDKDGNAVASLFAAVNNLTKTMQYETIASIGTYLCMLITQACYAIGTDSRYGEGDAVVLPSSLAGYVAASASFTKLSDKDVDMTAGTGAKLSGYIGGIKVYVDVQIPQNTPFVTVLRTNQDVKVEIPGLDGDQVLIPGLAYLVKDLISSTELVPSATGGKKLIADSETDLVAIGERAHAAYLTFAFYVQLPGLAG